MVVATKYYNTPHPLDHERWCRNWREHDEQSFTPEPGPAAPIELRQDYGRKKSTSGGVDKRTRSIKAPSQWIITATPMLNKASGYRDLTLAKVDGCQGHENRVIILDFVMTEQPDSSMR